MVYNYRSSLVSLKMEEVGARRREEGTVITLCKAAQLVGDSSRAANLVRRLPRPCRADLAFLDSCVFGSVES